MAHYTPVDPAWIVPAQTLFASGQYQKAIEELDNLDPVLRNHPNVLEMRYQIGAIMDDWSLSLEAASLLVEKAPERASAWIQRSTALHRLNCTRQALQMLEPAAAKFPREWQIPYQLARFACLSGQWEQTWDWLVLALGTGDPKKVRQIAMNDPDLKPFLAQITKV